MTSHRRLSLYCCVFMLGLVSTLWAQGSPLGVLKMESGSALIDGQAVKAAKLVYPGQKIELAADSSAVVSFLGSSRHARLAGPLTLVMDAPALEARSEKTERGELRISRQWLRVNRAGGTVTRAPAYLDPQLPPRQVMTGSNLFELVFQATPSALENRFCRVELFDPSLSTDTAFFTQMFQQTLVNPIIRTSAFVPGREYLLKVSLFGRNTDGTPGVQTASYTTSFRFLVPAEETALKEFREQQTLLFSQGQKVEALVALADMYGSLGQNSSALAVLTQLAGLEDELTNYPALQAELHQVITDVTRSVRMPLPTP